MFDKMIDRVLDHEGGYVNDPRDPGGETKFGISKRAYPDVDIKNLTREQAKAIYKRDYWDRARCADMHPAVAFQVLDFAVNSGIGTAIRKLQTAAGVADDGNVGPVTLSAIRQMPAPLLVMRYLGERLKFMAMLKVWPDFSRGWSKRIAFNLDIAAGDLQPTVN